jgi:SPP1 gp7 family putative phage head morphogenesis protein
MVAQLEAVEKDVRRQLRARVEKIAERGFDTGPVTTKRLRVLQASVREVLGRAYKSLGKELRSELLELSKFEVDFQARLIQANTPFVNLAFALPPADALRGIISAEPMRGRLLREMLRDAEAGAIRRTMAEIRLGIIEGETMPQIVRRVMDRGGPLGIGKRGTQAMVRTAVTHVTSRSKELFFSENTDIISGVMWVATLDSRTTPICQRLDGKVFEVNKGIRPPAHISCRSTTSPILDGQAEEFGDRASDVGPVPAKVKYNEWLGRQSAAKQNEILGPTRGKLFRKGGLSVDKFVDLKGHRFTLEELRLREMAAFERAGISS